MENFNKKDNQNLNSSLNGFLGQEQNNLNDENCTSEECRIKKDKSIVERVNKKIITEDGKQLLI